MIDGTTKYRKIYEKYHGSIPKEPDGRTYEIHHIDGDHTNNHPSNLKAVTLQEHYDIHYEQEDFSACLLMSIQRMNKSPEEISELVRLQQRKRSELGIHQWQGDGSFQRQVQKTLVENGTHNLIGGEIQRQSNQRRLKNGTHHLVGGHQQRQCVSEGKHPSKMKVSCLDCRTIASIANFKKWHDGKCVERKKSSAHKVTK
jgi:hypothetical protein